MKDTFLDYVARDLIAKTGGDLARTTIVFPNKRAALFMNEALSKAAKKTIWAPEYTTISELFRQHSTLTVADPLKLVCDLHSVFCAITQSKETLDHFFGWGQMLLADFDDIDKNLADADKVFGNLEAWHAFDELPPLTEEQRAELQRLFESFTNDQGTHIKNQFMQFWSRFSDIYHAFNKRLSDQRLAYEGALYRQVIGDSNVTFDRERYVFVGFNMLQTVEQQLFMRLRDEGKALFYWDYDRFYMENAESEASLFMRDNLLKFSNELKNEGDTLYNNILRPEKKIRFVAATTESAQAKYVSQWLKEDARYEKGRDTAVVMCNENVLKTVVHSLPDEVKALNITTGYPLQLSPFASLVSVLIALQTYGHPNQGNSFRLPHVLKVLRHPYATLIADDAPEKIKQLLEKPYPFWKTEELATSEGLSLIFRKIEGDGIERNSQLLSYILTLLERIGSRLDMMPQRQGSGQSETQREFMAEALYRTYTIINRLKNLSDSRDLSIELPLLQRLINQIIASTSVPFHGEPIEGVQMMGMLETRNLDFDHLLILSCNEGFMPRGEADNSFIPIPIRKAYGLTTPDRKTAIYAYYFYNLIQRANDITITYCDATGDTKVNEMSRFMMQLLISRKDIKKFRLKTNHSVTQMQLPTIDKDEKTMLRLNEIEEISPSRINMYLRCPLQFYYRTVLGIKETEDPDAETDSRHFGTVFHKAAELIYSAEECRSAHGVKQRIEGLLAEPKAIEKLVDEAFSSEIFNGKEPKYNGLQLIQRDANIRFITQLLRIDRQLGDFSVLGTEKEVEKDITFSTPDGPRTIKIKGTIDRLERVTPSGGAPYIRITDYKTGSPKEKGIGSVEDIFKPENVTKCHSDYYLQAILYARIAAQSAEINGEKLPTRPGLIFIQKAAAPGYDPILTINKTPIDDTADLANEFHDGLCALLRQIFSADVPFEPTPDKVRCTTCPYVQFCRSKA